MRHHQRPDVKFDVSPHRDLRWFIGHADAGKIGRIINSLWKAANGRLVLLSMLTNTSDLTGREKHQSAIAVNDALYSFSSGESEMTKGPGHGQRNSAPRSILNGYCCHYSDVSASIIVARRMQPSAGQFRILLLSQ